MTRWGSRLGNENKIHAELRQNELESDQRVREKKRRKWLLHPTWRPGSPARELGLEGRAAPVELGRPLLDIKAVPSARASTTTRPSQNRLGLSPHHLSNT